MRFMQSRLWWVLLAVAALLLVIGVAVAVAYLLSATRTSAEAGWSDPLAQIVPDVIAPDLALYPLAGASSLETVDAALVSGELETAFATLVFDTTMGDDQRIGRLGVLAGQFLANERPERAGRCYQLMVDLALASPELSDPVRANELVTSGLGWAELGQPSESVHALDQAYALAVDSPHLQPAYRLDLLASLQRAYEAVGEQEKAGDCRDRRVELEQTPNLEVSASPVRLAQLPGGETDVSSPEVGGLEDLRRQAAYALLQSASLGEEAAADLVQNLAQALEAEDAAKIALYESVLQATTQPGRRIDVHWHIIRWLTLKYRVASRGFGLSLVSEWEEDVTEIRTALSKAYEDLYFGYEDLVAGLPDASLISASQYRLRREMMLAGRLGHYPNYPVEQMADKLRDAALAMIAEGAVERLYLDVESDVDGMRFVLRGADEYQRSEVLP